MKRLHSLGENMHRVISQHIQNGRSALKSEMKEAEHIKLLA